MGSNFNEYIHVLKQLQSYNVSKDLQTSLWSYAMLVYQSDEQNKYSEPMPWIGMYIALASLICILAMVADLLHGFLNKKLWFPCKYFTMNAASLTMIAIAMKLPMDLNNPMPSAIDQLAKIGSIPFMCTMMANLLPSLANMDNKELLTNIIAFGILVITLVVNVCIQINTGVFSYAGESIGSEIALKYNSIQIYFITDESFVATLFIPMLLMLLIIHICSSLAILNSKQMIESKYQAGHEAALKELDLQLPRRLSCEKLKQHVSNYWIMAGTGNPQFMAVCFTTTSASGAICVVTTILYTYYMYYVLIRYGTRGDYRSDYTWSMLVIVVIQSIGVILGAISPLFRFFATLSFKLSVKWIWNHIKVFKVESYWTDQLSDWKKSRIPFSFGSRKCKILIQNIKIIVLSLCILLQMTIVLICKMIGLVPILLVICIRYCWKWLKAILSASGIMLAGKPTDQLERDKDLSFYVLLLQDDMDLANRTLTGLSKSVNRLIQKAEKRQPNNLLNLLKVSSGFEGVKRYDNHHVPLLPAKEYLDCWSLALVTLTTIAISLPNIQSNIVDRLLSSVSEGLTYVTLVEEILNGTSDYANIQKAAKILWLEVEVYHKWLGNKLQKVAPQENSAGHILQRLKHTSIKMVLEVESTHIGSLNNDSIHRSVCANSMYRITESILLYYHTNIEQVSQEKLFVELSSMISDILSACLINLPQVIVMKCYTSAIEKREANIHVAARLLGETTQIIHTLQDRELPILNPQELAFIDKWRTYLQHPFP